MTMHALLLIAAAVTGMALPPPPVPPDEPVAERIRTRVEAAGGEPLYERAALGGFYARRSFRPAWSNEQGPNRLADDLVDALGRADLEGLWPEDYHLAGIRALLTAVREDASSGRTTEPDRLAELDLLLTDAFLLYGSHLLAGRVDPETLHPRWEANRRGADLATVLEDALDSRNVARALQRLAPTQDGYRWLRGALARERAAAASGGWPALPEGPVLKRGDRAPAVAVLRERLRLEGDLRADGKRQDAELFDAALEQAVQQFQQRHGLEAVGVVTPTTRAELNVSAATRAEQLRLNLERWRWLPQDLGRRRIIVNIAAYELEVIEDEVVVLAMRVVVGKRYRRTPVFSDTVRYIVLNPSWYVPRNIAVQDLLPKIQHDPSYLERFQMHVFEGSAPIDPATVDWSAVTADNFKYRLNQEPGRLNALGRIKFAFPNAYDVYLHDTPSRELFDEAQRDFSSGCIRLEKPLDLAVYLMKKNGRWNREALELALDEGTERAVYLPRPMPVQLLYWTAWADEDGTIQFRSDIHGLDRPLADALQAPLSTRD
ncbi:MAG: L,D-transpeptidase family protein [Gemmatimonadales bacterium]